MEGFVVGSAKRHNEDGGGDTARKTRTDVGLDYRDEVIAMLKEGNRELKEQLAKERENREKRETFEVEVTAMLMRDKEELKEELARERCQVLQLRREQEEREKNCSAEKEKEKEVEKKEQEHECGSRLGMPTTEDRTRRQEQQPTHSPVSHDNCCDVTTHHIDSLAPFHCPRMVTVESVLGKRTAGTALAPCRGPSAEEGLINHLQTAVEHREPEAEARAGSPTTVKVSEEAGRLVLQKYENRPFSIREEAGELICEKTLDRHIEPLYEANSEFFRQVAFLSIPLEVHRIGTYVVFRLYDSPSFFARHFIDVKSMRRRNGCFCGALVRRVPSVCMQEPVAHCLKEADLARGEAEKLHIMRMGPNSGPVVEALFTPTKVFSNTVSNARLEFIIPWESRFERRVDYNCQAIFSKRENTIRYSDYLFTSDCASQEPVDIDDMMPE